MNAQHTLDLVSRILGIAIAFSSAQWMVASERFRLDLLYGWDRKLRKVVRLTLFVRFVAGLGLVTASGFSGSIVIVCLISVFLSDLIIYRPMKPNLTAVFRMTHILVAVLLIAQSDDLAVKSGALAAVAGVSVLSYITTGLTKLVSPGWRNGRTLKLILGSRTNGFYPLFAWMISRPRWRSLLALMVIAFECLFPLLLLKGARGAVLFCLFAAMFHATLAIIMGMNLFLFTWGATYPAIIFVAANAQTLAWSLLFESGRITLLFCWFAALVVWQMIARIRIFKRRNEAMFYFLLYEFYMFAIRHPDPGVRYIVSRDEEHAYPSDEWKELPLPWRRRLIDGLWNPEHEAKKAVRHVANQIQLSTGEDTIYFKRLADWLRVIGKYEKSTKFDFRILSEDSFEHAHHSPKAAANV